jgi:transcriptional regulator with XRE-family HTH domain
MRKGTVPVDGEKVRKLREKNGWSQKDLHEKSKVSLGEIKQIERGKVEGIFPRIRKAIADALDVNYDDLEPKRHAGRSVELHVGLASESPELFELAFDIYAACANSGPDEGGSFKLKCTKISNNEDSYNEFCNNYNHYDIIMIDDPWVPEFSSRTGGVELWDLRELRPIKEFERRRPFEEVFLRPLIEVCKYPNGSDKLRGLPILGNVQFLCYEKGEVWPGPMQPQLDNQVLDPDKLKGIIVSIRHGADPDSIATFHSTRPLFAIRNLDDNHVVENFWQVLRGYGYEDTHNAGEAAIPMNLAERALSWMDTVDPAWENRVEGLEPLDRLIEGRGPMMMFGWPNWVLSKVRNDPTISVKIGLNQFAKHPVLGA